MPQVKVKKWLKQTLKLYREEKKKKKKTIVIMDPQYVFTKYMYHFIYKIKLAGI